MYDGKRVIVILPAYNEAEGIEASVREFKNIEEVDEVLVIDNNSTDRTAEIAAGVGAHVLREEKQGYGYACQRGLSAANGDLVCIAEPDGTFVATDLRKLLLYSNEFDAVFGTRTSKSCIWEGSNMGYFLRYGNCAVAKYLEYIHNGPCLTDVGCTFKLISRTALDKVNGMMSVGGSAFSPELMIRLIRRGVRCVEIPVNYRPRVGQSKITGKLWRAFTLGLRMIWLITKMRIHRV